MSELVFEAETTEFTPVEKANPFTDLVAQHIAEAESNPSVAKVITVDVNDATKAQLFYQKAANAQNKTAKLRSRDESAVKVSKPDAEGEVTKTGKVKLTFTITKRNRARRGAAAETSAEAAAE